MDSARVKTLRSSGCSNSFGSFELIFPQNLHGVIEPLEFETTIKTINARCHTVMDKKYYLIFLISVLGLILSIVGFSKTANNVDPSNPSGASGGLALIVIGFILMFLGCCGYMIVFAIFRNKVLNKIRAELDLINLHFGTRRISWNLESEVVRKYIPIDEYNFHKNNQAYRNSIKFDHHNRPYKEETVHFIEIQFPARSVPTNVNILPVQFIPQMVSVPNQGINQGINFSSNMGGAHISLDMNSKF
ncbi:hypothetical protein ACTA71_007240 [Dictyostelium dimigraforme]